ASGWGPRVGLAFQLTPNTVLRGGAGIYYATVKVPGLGGGANNGFASSPSWNSGDQGITPAYDWDDGFPEWEAPPFINPGFNAGFSVPWFGADEIAKLPSSSTWNFAISQVLASNFVVDATYTGSKGTHLASDRVNYMQIDPRYAGLGSLLNKPIDDPEVAALGFTAPFPNFKELLKGNATLGQSLRMFPQYQNVTTGGMMNHSGNSTYHAVILKLTKRFSAGLTLLTSYTWSKLLTDADSSEPWIAGVVGSRVGAGAAQNHFNRKNEKSYGVLDFPQQFKLTGSYDLPFGKGKKFLNSGIASHILGDWNFATFLYYQSGFPMGVTDSGFQNFLRAGSPRPNVLTHDWRAPTQGDRFDPDKDNFYNLAAFQRRTDPASDPFGNAPRLNGDTRWFPVTRQNITLTKTIRFTERVSSDLRWEVYNLYNQKVWNTPNNDLASPLFGVVTGASGHRTMQFGLKLSF
ncbi:MAG: hypothetical protein ACRD7E_11695, partial [Bryobacteraceae bacterium]